LAGLREISANYSNVSFENSELELETMRLDEQYTELMRMDTTFYQASNTIIMTDRPVIWQIAFCYEVGLGARLICRVNSAADDEVKLVISYGKRILAFRGLGRIMSASVAAMRPGFSIERLNFEECLRYESFGFMAECSRNAVIRVEEIESLIRTLALAGLNMLMLYTEDTYQMENEPFFGYLRGPYSPDDLKRMYAYAGKFDIEMIPTIQTLGHLGQILQWPRFSHLRDTSEVLLVHYEQTYTLLERMIRTATANNPSRRIHIGMDEVSLHAFVSSRSIRLTHPHCSRHMASEKDVTGLFMVIWMHVVFSLIILNALPASVIHWVLNL
jgi:hypothetical protein